MTIEIRTAVDSDVLALIDYVAELRAERLPTIFRHETLPTPQQESDFLRQFHGERACFFVALDGARVVGNLGIAAHPLPQMRHAASFGMSVLAPHRGQGIGSRLLDTAIAWARRQPLRRIELEVLANNPGARQLYARKGFELEGRRRGGVEVDGAFVDVLGMALQLEPASDS